MNYKLKIAQLIYRAAQNPFNFLGEEMTASKRFILTYEAKVRTGPRSFWTRSFHQSKPLTISQARKFYNKLQRCKQVLTVGVKYAKGLA